MKKTELKIMNKKRYTPFFESANLDNANNVALEIESTIKRHFPKSYVRAKFEKGLTASIYIMFTLGDRNQYVNNIADNDIALVKAHIWNFNDDGSFDGKLEFEASQGGGIYVKPEEGSYMAMGRVKIGLRKKTGTPEQIIKHIDSYFGKLKKTLNDVKDRIMPDAYELIKNNF